MLRRTLLHNIISRHLNVFKVMEIILNDEQSVSFGKYSTVYHVCQQFQILKAA